MSFTKEQTTTFLKLRKRGMTWSGVAAYAFGRPSCDLSNSEIEAVRKATMRETWASRRQNPSHRAKNGVQASQKCQKTADLARNPVEDGHNAQISSFEDVSGSKNEITINKTVFLDPDTPKTPETILKAFGYDPVLWSVKRWHVGSWDSPNTEGTRACYMVRATLEPKKPADFSEKDYEELANRAFSGLKPLKCPKIAEKLQNSDDFGQKWHDSGLLLEIPPVELHFGKMASPTAEKCKYDLDVASNVFNGIFEHILLQQSTLRAGKALVVIGGDFFNSESTGTTTKGTKQDNAAGYHDVFIRGLQLYEDAVFHCSKYFPKVDVMLCPGNHDRAMDFFLFIALKKRFMTCPNVKFIENYHDTQAYRFGDCAIFYNHGDANYKRTVASIPAEFSEIWGKTKYRELHMGHLHSEKVADEDMGMIVRRVGAPCPPDSWHYTNRFIGAVPKHQTFVWSDRSGLRSINYIPVLENNFQR